MTSNNNNTMPDRPRPGFTTTALSIDNIQDGNDKSTTGYSIRLPKKITSIGTWNVRTLNRTGKIEELTNELSRYKWDIVGLSETRLNSCGELTTNEGHKIYYSGREKHQEGVGFIVRKELINAVLNYTTISNRVISIRLKASPINITIIQIYAPTSTYNDEEIEQFYETVDNTIQESHKKNILIVQGDFNAKIGSDENEEWAECVGRFGIGVRNDRGQRLLEFAGKHRLVAANTLFPYKKSRCTTWHSPNGEVYNQIDYILTPQRFKSSIIRTSTRTYPGADINSDHDLVLYNMKLKLKVNRKPKTTRIRFDVNKLTNGKTADNYKDELEKQLKELDIHKYDLTTSYKKIEDILIDSATRTIGKYRRKNNHGSQTTYFICAMKDDLLNQLKIRTI